MPSRSSPKPTVQLTASPPASNQPTHTQGAQCATLDPPPSCSQPPSPSSPPHAAAANPAQHQPPVRHPRRPSALDDQFLQAVHTANIESWTTAAPTDTELLGYPVRWCSALGEGHSIEYLFGLDGDMYPIGDNWGTKKADAQRVLVMAVTTYCPKYHDTVTAELRAAGDY